MLMANISQATLHGVHECSLLEFTSLLCVGTWSWQGWLDSCAQGLLLTEILRHFLNAVSHSLWATKQGFLMLGQFLINKV